MSDQQAMMAMQNPQAAQQLAAANPEIAQQAIAQRPDVAAQIMPGAMAAASSGMNAPNISPMQDVWNGMKTRAINGVQDPKMWQTIGGIGKMMPQQQGALAPAMAPMSPHMGQQGQIGQMAQKMPGVLMQARPSRIF